jgi:CRP-like cAMP-binding protein
MRTNAVLSVLAPETIAGLLPRTSFIKFNRGEYIFRRGDPGTSLFGVVSGSVRMSTSSVGGKRAVLNLISTGQTFGEIALLDRRERTTDAIAHVGCEVWRIERRDLLALLQSQPALAMKFIELLCARLRWTTEHLEQLIQESLSARLAHMIVRLAERNPRRDGMLVLEITQQNLGDMIGISRESTNKLMSHWAERHWIRVQHRHVVILNPGALKRAAKRS